MTCTRWNTDYQSVSSGSNVDRWLLGRILMGIGDELSQPVCGYTFCIQHGSKNISPVENFSRAREARFLLPNLSHGLVVGVNT